MISSRDERAFSDITVRNAADPATLWEVMLKVLAHNVSRLLAAKKLSRVYCSVTPDGFLEPLGIVFPSTL